MTEKEKKLLERFAKTITRQLKSIKYRGAKGRFLATMVQATFCTFIDLEERAKVQRDLEVARLLCMTENVQSYQDRIDEIDNSIPMEDAKQYDKICNLCTVFVDEKYLRDCTICPLGPTQYGCMNDTYIEIDEEWFKTSRSALRKRMNWLLEKYADKGYAIRLEGKEPK